MAADHNTAIFLAELILLLFFGRAIGELMSRVGQPAIFGQLLAGIILGPSVFGALFPVAHKLIFPGTPALKSMIDAISQIGILLLLLLTGMETNLGLVRRQRSTVLWTSLLGIAVPFVSGVIAGYLIPEYLVPSPGARLVTALFLGTALSISSVKIVAVVLMEVGAIRRDLGQLILATAILDDTIAWVLIALISSLAAKGGVSLAHLAASIGGCALFLVVCLTLGRRVVADVIRWTNDNMTVELPVVSAIFLIMMGLALTTDLIGVHTALGAFVAGMLVGQSPILTDHIEQQLKGLIVAFFSPIFFAVAGLGMDVRTLFEPKLMLVTLALIVIASFGKFAGALAGGRLGGLTTIESLALATGLNARGSTEVIIASIGLAMGALGNELYTMIVAMAVITTMAMPPTLRWIIARVPLREEEARRLEKEDAEESRSLPAMERGLLTIEKCPNGELASETAGLVAASAQLLTTVMETGSAEPDDPPRWARKRTAKTAERALLLLHPEPPGRAAAEPPLSADELVRGKSAKAADAVIDELANGYDLVFAGIDKPILDNTSRFEPRLQRLLDAFEGPVAIAFNAEPGAFAAARPLRILVPTGGSPEAKFATEIALALAKASGGELAALHAFNPEDDIALLRATGRREGLSVLIDARRLGRRSGVPVKGLTVTTTRPMHEISRMAGSGAYDLLVLGVTLRRGETKFLSPRTFALVRSARCPILVIAR